MRGWLWVLVGVVVLVVIAGVMFFKGPDLKKYEMLKDPRIINKPDAPVLEVVFEVKSDGLKKVFGVLFGTYYKLSGVPKGPGMSAPAARYENTLDFAMAPEKRAAAFVDVIWKGSAAIPIPASVKTLPVLKTEPGLTPKISVWSYGEVAEILHKGAYEDEPPTIKRLMEYIQTQGYEIAGLHEEEYLRGPGMPFVKPKDFVTIIRYPVKKAEKK